MESKVSYFITSERALSQLKHWLKSVHGLSIEEFVVLYKVYEATKSVVRNYVTHYILKCYGTQVKLM